MKIINHIDVQTCNVIMQRTHTRLEDDESIIDTFYYILTNIYNPGKWKNIVTKLTN